MATPLLLAFFLTHCNKAPTGKALALKHCSACHLVPPPALLDKKTWDDRVFPEMALRTGLDMSRLPPVTTAEMNEILKAIPPQPLLEEKEWEAIRAFYLSNAPESLALPDFGPSQPLASFSTETVHLPLSNPGMITLVRADTLAHQLFVGTRQGKLYRLDTTLHVLDSVPMNSAPSDILFSHGDAIVSCMGIMDPNDQPAGTIVRLPTASPSPQVLVDSLKRPVHMQAADLDRDGDEDLVVSAFGNFTGGLVAFEAGPQGYQRHIVHSFPGTRKSIVRDFNDDGLPDILALITQGDEKIALFTNRGNFRFSFRIVLRFPPVYGSSYFELADFNGDGHDDILYTNGDNADYSPVLKPYHGVRIFLNDGQNHFEESWFHPMNGASMARACDFDRDGDLDIAAISFFPDFRRTPQRGFLYFRNDGGTFTAFETPAGASARWITMEIVDLDGDHDTDIILGALNFPAGVPSEMSPEWSKGGTSLLVLRNQVR